MKPNANNKTTGEHGFVVARRIVSDFIPVDGTLVRGEGPRTVVRWEPLHFTFRATEADCRAAFSAEYGITVDEASDPAHFTPTPLDVSKAFPVFKVVNAYVRFIVPSVEEGAIMPPNGVPRADQYRPTPSLRTPTNMRKLIQS